MICLYNTENKGRLSLCFRRVNTEGRRPCGRYKNMDNTKDKGSFGELLVMLKTAEKGFAVCIPYGENHRYDLALEREGKFQRVQVKSLAPVEGKITLQLYTVQHNKDPNDVRQYKRVFYSASDVDTLAIVNTDTNDIYMIPYVDVDSKTAIILRTDRSMKMRKSNKARWADEYLW